VAIRFYVLAADADRAGRQVQIASAQCDRLAPAQAREGGQQDQHPVAAGRHAVGQIEDLGDGEHRPFGRLLVATAADPAWVARDDAILGRGHENGTEQPVSLGRSGL
jgi:hypothetical protein